jgi:chlorobactene glucosyltransferase
MDIFVTIVTVFLTLIALITIVNVITFPRLDVDHTPSFYPFVSIMVPARNERNIIAGTVRSWASVIYPNYEVIILDDCSSDDTFGVASQAADGDSHVHVLAGVPVPSGWKGKNWACQQMAQVARGEVLLFTDADVQWTPMSLAALIAEMDRSSADLLSVWPTQISHTWTERLVVPLLGFVIMGYLPVLAVHHCPWSIFSAAIGQCLFFQRQAYEAIGGHAAIRDSLVDDMTFAKVIKSRRLQLRTADGARLVSTRMYHSWKDVRDGFAKNILAGHGNSLLFLVFSTFFHWSLFILPWIWMIFRPMQGMILVTIGILTRALSAVFTRQRLLDAVFLPISILLMTTIAARSVWWQFTGGVQWKERVYGP